MTVVHVVLCLRFYVGRSFIQDCVNYKTFWLHLTAQKCHQIVLCWRHKCQEAWCGNRRHMPTVYCRRWMTWGVRATSVTWHWRRTMERFKQKCTKWCWSLRLAISSPCCWIRISVFTITSRFLVCEHTLTHCLHSGIDRVPRRRWFSRGETFHSMHN